MKILIDLNMDGYETEEDHNEACLEFVKDQLDFSASSVDILWYEKIGESIDQQALEMGVYQ